ncbi:MAG: hypothetical protein Q8J78_06170 [Moraxellaceae bacterium]|nr:hypothetical protein [Moraxellaceae bacterium]
MMHPCCCYEFQMPRKRYAGCKHLKAGGTIKALTVQAVQLAGGL